MAPNTVRDQMSWTTDMRIGLRTLVVLTSKKWDIVRDLWYQEFADLATGKSNDTRLKHCLMTQHSMRDRTDRPASQRPWLKIGSTIAELEQQAPELVARLKTAYLAVAPSHQRQQQSVAKSHTGVTAIKPSKNKSNEPSTEAASKPARHASILQHVELPLQQAPRIHQELPAREVPTRKFGPHTVRATGQDINEYLAQRRNMDHGPPVDIAFNVAHPPLPVLFYRYYDTATEHVCNAPLTKGFVSAYYNGPTIHQGFSIPPGAADDRLIRDIEVHVNMRKFPPTPFVSVTSNLHWVMTAAALKSKKGQNMRISIIDAKAAAGNDGHKAYHVQAYYNQLRERAAFDDLGKMMYRGAYEYLVWAHIPPTAVIADYSFDEITQYTSDYPDDTAHKILRLPRLAVQGQGGSDAIRRKWLKEPVDMLEESTVNFLASFAMWLLCHKRKEQVQVSLSDALTKLTSDLICGWAMRPSRALDREGWSQYAFRFSEVIHNNINAAVTANSRHNLAKAFLFGIISGLGEPNWYMDDAYKAALLATMARYGLEQPDNMLSPADNALVAGVRSMMHGHRQLEPPQMPKTPSRKRDNVGSVATPTMFTPSSSESGHYQTPAISLARYRYQAYADEDDHYSESPSLRRHYRSEQAPSLPRRVYERELQAYGHHLHRDARDGYAPSRMYGHPQAHRWDHDMDYEYSDGPSPW